MINLTSDAKIDRINLEEISKIFSTSTKLNSKVFDDRGNIIASTSFQENLNFCDLVWNKGKGKELCKHAYIHGGLQSAKKGDVYVYFCPFGLVKWSLSLLKNDRIIYFVSAGPVLVHPVDDLMVERVLKKSENLRQYSSYVRKYLKEIDYIESERIYSLARLLLYLVKGIIGKDSMETVVREENEKAELNKHAWVNSRLHQHEAENIDRETLKDQFLRGLLDKEKELLGRIEVGDEKGVRKIKDWLANELYSFDGDSELLKLRMVELVVTLSRQAIDLGADIEIVFEKEYLYFHKIQDCKDKDELCKCFEEVLDEFLQIESSALEDKRSKNSIRKAENFIKNNFRKELKLEDVAKEAGLSPAYFSRVFKEGTGYSFTEYLNRLRIRLSKELLKQYTSLAEVALLVGYSDQSYFCKTFKRITGMSPGQYKKALNKSSIRIES